jgi:hypothetical protein
MSFKNCIPKGAEGNEFALPVYDFLNRRDQGNQIQYVRTSQGLYNFPQSEIDVQGLDKLNVSMSSQYTKNGFMQLQNLIPKQDSLVREAEPPKLPLYVVDARTETHFMVNDNVSLSYGFRYNWIDTMFDRKQKLIREKERMSALQNFTTIQPYEWGRRGLDGGLFIPSITIENPILELESEFLKTQNVKYFRSIVYEDSFPCKNELKKYLKFLSKLPTNGWLHIHDQTGFGRTSLYFSIFDMLHNAYKVPLHNFYRRGSLAHLDKTFTTYVPWDYTLEKTENIEEVKRIQLEYRLNFINKFYNYAKKFKGFEDWKSKKINLNF